MLFPRIAKDRESPFCAARSNGVCERKWTPETECWACRGGLVGCLQIDDYRVPTNDDNSKMPASIGLLISGCFCQPSMKHNCVWIENSSSRARLPLSVIGGDGVLVFDCGKLSATVGIE